jgi:YVTN family beta-propeller protein
MSIRKNFQVRAFIPEKTGGVGMTLSFKKLWLAAVTAVFVLAAAGCNDTLRQFIIPIPKPGGDSGTLSHAIILSTNPASATSNGSTMHIDASGDTIVGVVPTGPNPVFLSIANNRVFVINGDNTITAYIALLPTTPPFSTVVLPAAANKPVAGGSSSSGNFFTTNLGSGDSSIVSGSLLAAVGTITVGTNPVAIAGNAANSKMYVVNQGSETVTVVSTTDNSVVKTIPLVAGSQPIWGVMAANGVQVFIVNQGNGTVSVIDTTLDAVIPCADGPGVPNCPSPFTAITVGASPNFGYYDPNRQRLYVSNTGVNKVSVIKADGIDLGPPRILPRWLADVTVSSAPVSVAALADGSKVYAALGGCPAGTNHTNLVSGATNLPSCLGNQVSVIDANALVEKKTITVGLGAVSVATSSSSLRAFAVSAHDSTTIIDNVHAPNCTSNCLPGPVLPPRTFSTPSIYDIKTSTDTAIPRITDPTVTSSPIPTFLAPSQDPTCTATIDPNFNKTVPMPCIGQTAFMVRTFP